MWHPWIARPPLHPSPGPASSPAHHCTSSPSSLSTHAHSLPWFAFQDSIQTLLSLAHPRSSRRRQRRPCSSAGWRSHLPPIQVGFDRIVHLSTRAWGRKQHNWARWPARTTRGMRQGAQPLCTRGLPPPVTQPTGLPPLCQGKPCLRALSSRPQPDNHTSRAAAGDRLVWPPWPLRPAVRDHDG